MDNGSFGALFHIGELIKTQIKENYIVVIPQKIKNKKSAT
jgi:hypothetical protein